MVLRRIKKNYSEVVWVHLLIFLPFYKRGDTFCDFLYGFFQDVAVPK